MAETITADMIIHDVVTRHPATVSPTGPAAKWRPGMFIYIAARTRRGEDSWRRGSNRVTLESAQVAVVSKCL